MRPFSLSVVVCTHNPRIELLRRTLAALAAQTLRREEWELLVVDNASREPVAAKFDLSWHPHARNLIETRLGLTHARICGIAATQSELLVFVDDDNVLAPDYLAHVVAIAREFPFLGAWGGRIAGEFEIDPPPWSRRYLGLLAIREFSRDSWNNSLEAGEETPCGAGLCIRASVARHYADAAKRDSLRLNLGRSGSALGSAEDTDMALTACDQGMGVGAFTRLRLRHIIPKERLTIPYFIALMEGIARSTVLLKSRRQTVSRPIVSGGDRALRTFRRWRLDATTRAIQDAAERGAKSAYDQLGV